LVHHENIIVILHNVIIENERGKEEDFDYEQDGGELLRPKDFRRDPLVLSEFLCIHNAIEG
jgi:hypothetical protein